jgi:hypothetical protein
VQRIFSHLLDKELTREDEVDGNKYSDSLKVFFFCFLILIVFIYCYYYCYYMIFLGCFKRIRHINPHLYNTLLFKQMITFMLRRFSFSFFFYLLLFIIIVICCYYYLLWLLLLLVIIINKG